MLKAAAAFAAFATTVPASAAWEPSKPVEIVVAAGAGGASDQMARMMQAAIQKNNLIRISNFKKIIVQLQKDNKYFVIFQKNKSKNSIVNINLPCTKLS